MAGTRNSDGLTLLTKITETVLRNVIQPWRREIEREIDRFGIPDARILMPPPSHPTIRSRGTSTTARQHEPRASSRHQKLVPHPLPMDRTRAICSFYPRHARKSRRNTLIVAELSGEPARVVRLALKLHAFAERERGGPNRYQEFFVRRVNRILIIDDFDIFISNGSGKMVEVNFILTADP